MSRKITHLSERGLPLVFQKKSAGKTVVSLFFALCVAMLSFSFLGCPMEGDTSTGNDDLDPKLIGAWEFIGPYNAERYIITGTTFTYGSLSTDDNKTFTENFSGTIAYAKSFSDITGVIIIKYNTGHKQVWPDSNSWHEDPPDSGNWVANPLDPQPAGDFYGIYYVNLDSAGTTVFLANTSNLADYSYGPTETETLAAAKAKFTDGNINNYIDISVGDPQHKVTSTN